MDFHEKLQKLRANEHLTQEELAEKLFVSRTAISKWESGRGYPSIDSLKAIAKYFHVTIDELIGGEEIVSLAQEDIKASDKRKTALLCGLLDCLALLLLILPVFGNGVDTPVSASLFALTGVSGWLKTLFIATVCITVCNGLCMGFISQMDREKLIRCGLIAGLALSVFGTALFIAARQPYAGIFYFCMLVTKGIFLLKTK